VNSFDFVDVFKGKGWGGVRINSESNFWREIF